jgi:putative transposase
MKPYNPSEEKKTSRRKLPHWEQGGCTYFVTFRLHDSIPKNKLADWNLRRERWLRSRKLDATSPYEEILACLPSDQKNEYYETFWKGYHDMLDDCHGSCILRESQNAEIVSDALLYFQGERYQMGDFVIMPNHVHLLVVPHPDETLEKALHSWKRYTARLINQRRNEMGQLWQHESYDHIVRNEAQMKRIQKYIQSNPKNLRLGEFLYFQSRTSL